MHLRLEVGAWWLQVGKDTPVTEADPGDVSDRQQPATIYAPEYVGFIRLTEPTD